MSILHFDLNRAWWHYAFTCKNDSSDIRENILQTLIRLSLFLRWLQNLSLSKAIQRYPKVLLPERIHQLLRHIIITERVLEGQVKKVVGLDYVAKTVPVSVAAKFATFAVNIDVYVLRQLLHILHPATFGIAIAYKPSYRLAFTPDGVQYRRWYFAYRVPCTCENWLVLAYSR